MPNWCENKITIHGDPKVIAAFKQKALHDEPEGRYTALSLNKLYPEPQYSDDQPDAQYRWRMQNWGTKWDVEAYIDTESENHLVYYFDSAWSPPIEWLEKVAKDYPKLSFDLEYIETGVFFCGKLHIENEDVVNEQFEDNENMLKYAELFGFGDVLRECINEGEAK